MVEDPEQAVYIIEWEKIEVFKAFLSSPACAEFLRSLPEDDSSRGTIESDLALEETALDEASSSLPSAQSRFLILRGEFVPSCEVMGRVTVTSFSVPRADTDAWAWEVVKPLRRVFRGFIPGGSEFLRYAQVFSDRFSHVWMEVAAEDYWVQDKFGQPGLTPHGNQDRVIFCHMFPWPLKFGAGPKHENLSAADPEAQKSWAQRISRVMPPATAWKQERWDIQEIPLCFPPELDSADEDDSDGVV